MGDFWLGRYLFLPGIAAYTERGTRTTADFLSFAPSGNSGNAPPSKVRGFIVPGYWGSDAISVGNKRANSPIVAWMMSSSLLAIQFVSPPAMGEQGAKLCCSLCCFYVCTACAGAPICACIERKFVM